MPRKAKQKADITPSAPLSGQPLRPCPFCGSSDLWVNSDLEPKFVACEKCCAFGPTAPTVAEATERWNKRL
ncbi:Lar family restriction alleviation protein [Bradyrhizobium sp. STM 3562]|uniref:Lar family restriction alleviation protein n=1 Tax=Bradyrhizobium sp. STM 3562 TaxID=578924 RepID=UPI00388F5845